MSSTHHTNAGYSGDPHDLDDIIDRLHIGTLRREQLVRARRSILIDDDTPPLTHYEAEALAKSETYSITSEESYHDRKPRRKTSGSSKDSGASSLGPSPQPKEKKAKPPKSKDQEVQTSIGKNFPLNKLQDVYAAEEGILSHTKPPDEPVTGQLKLGSKISKIFKSSKKSTSDDNHNTVAAESGPPPLPHTFIVKYMGSKPAKGYSGAKYIQAPVEEVVESVNQLSKTKGSDLPLVKLEVTHEGLNMTPHKRNKVKSYESVSIPIQYISYGSQDQNFPRIFCFIMVREMSARSKKLDCHVYACDSSKSARKAAACLAYAFHIYQENMGGQPAQYAAPISPGTHHVDDDAKSSYDV